MKYSSIKTRFFLSFILILIIFALSVYILSNLFIDRVVISANKSLITNIFIDNKNYLEVKNVNKSLIDSIAGSNDIGIVIYDKGEILSCSSLFLCSENNKQLPTYVTKYFNSIKISESKFFTFNYKLLEVNQLVYIYNLGDGRYIVINKALDSIQQINNLLRPFIGYTTLFLFIIGSIVIRIVSIKISKPIIKISNYANDIANLQFNQKITIDSKDEIGQLANNMNYISERLHFSLEELKKANELLTEDLNKEKELDKKRVRFFSTVSHELKTPLTIIQGYAEGITNNIVKNPEDIKDYLDVIVDETKKMNKLVNDLLNLSLYESENFILNKSHFNLYDLVEKVSLRYQDSIKDRKINWKIISPKSVMINADQFRIEQVITNFLSNAIKYVDSDGMIRVTIVERAKSVYLTFFNNGEKIKEDELENIWDLFYKLDNNHKNNIGTGLGLAIIKSIVELHHGRYGVENKTDGVEFFIELPNK